MEILKRVFSYPGINFSQFEGAELVAQRFNVSREEMEHLV
jgi:hypothetical protein